MCRYFLLLFVFYLLSGFNVLAGNITHYQIYTTADGLSHRVVRDILQDRNICGWLLGMGYANMTVVSFLLIINWMTGN